MAIITFTIPDDKLDRVKDGLLHQYPNNERDANGDPKYTDTQWLKERIRRFIVESVKLGEQKALHDVLLDEYKTISELPDDTDGLAG